MPSYSNKRAPGQEVTDLGQRAKLSMVLWLAKAPFVRQRLEREQRENG
jgi:hypothetical protein